MQVTISINVDLSDLPTLHRMLENFEGGFPAASSGEPTATVTTTSPVSDGPSKPKRKRRTKAEMEAARAAEAAVEPEIVDDDPFGLEDDKPVALTADDVKTAVKARIERDGGPEQVKAILASYKAKKFPEIPESEWPGVVAKLES